MSDFAVKDLLVPVLPESEYTRDCDSGTAICPTPPTAPDCDSGTAICPTPPTAPDCGSGTAICPTPPTGPGGRVHARDEEALKALSAELDRILGAR